MMYSCGVMTWGKKDRRTCGQRAGWMGDRKSII